MRYEPIKKVLGGFFGKSPFLRKLLYIFLDLLLLRTWHVRKAIRKIARRLPSNAMVLDAGSGLGQYTWRMSSRYGGWKIKGIDINSEEITGCTDFFMKTGRSERVHFETCDLVTFSEKSVYDLILTVDVMEHIEEDKTVFSNFFNALKERGFLLISTPSDKGGSDVQDEDDSSFIDEHVRDGYGKEEITAKLSEAGFSKINVRYTYGRAGHISWILSMKYPVRLLNISYLFFIILPFYYLLFYPVSFFLNIIDQNISHKTGTGLIVIAEKVR
jgi:SAM-dependent methyltransferase